MDSEEYEKQVVRVAQYKAWSEQLGKLESVVKNSGCYLEAEDGFDSMTIKAVHGTGRLAAAVTLDKPFRDRIRRFLFDILEEQIGEHKRALENL